MPGILADRTGSYVPAYIIFTVQIAAALVLVILSYRQTGGNAACP